jgi:hypothetical protein
LTNKDKDSTNPFHSSKSDGISDHDVESIMGTGAEGFTLNCTEDVGTLV